MPTSRSKPWMMIAAALAVAAAAVVALRPSRPTGPPPSAAALGIDERMLAGIPPSLRPSLEDARKNGAPGLREWMRQNEKRCLDPFLGWIQLEYAVLARDSKPDEAKVYFEMVKIRTATNSPIVPRIDQLKPYFR